MNSVMLRLPDGTLQSVEDYIVGIIKDASSQIEKERQNTSITADDILDKSADVENVQQIPQKPQLNNSTHGKHSTRNDFQIDSHDYLNFHCIHFFLSYIIHEKINC